MSGLQEYLKQMVTLKLQMGAARAGYYAGIEDYLLHHARAYSSRALTPKETQLVKYVRSRNTFPVKQCFQNSQRVALDHDEFKYVEGYVLRHNLPIPIQHAWLDLNGAVVDLTLRKTMGGTGLVAVGQFTATDYFGATFSTAEVRAFVLTTQYWGSLLDDRHRGWPYMQIGYKP